MAKKELYILITICILAASNIVMAQSQLEVYRGNKAYENAEYDEAKTHYEKALAANPNSYKGTYNLGNTNFRSENYEDALAQYAQALDKASDDKERADALHNIGNAHMSNGKFEEAITSYKKALRIEPNADDTRYNLSYAQKMLKQQQKQEQEQEQNQDQDKDQDKEKEEKEEKDDKDGQGDQEKNENEEDKDGDKKEDQDKEEKNEDGKDSEDEKPEPEEGDEKDQKPQPKPLNISPQQAEQMLEAAKNEDQKLQMQLRKQKGGQSKKIEKDW